MGTYSRYVDDSRITKEPFNSLIIGSKNHRRTPRSWADDAEANLSLINAGKSEVMNRVVWGTIVKKAVVTMMMQSYSH